MRLKTAIPAQSGAAGSTARPSRSTSTFIQSSRRPIISTTIGVRPPVSRPAAARRASPRSAASAAATAWATVNDTVAIVFTPRNVASSTAAIPAAVAGNLTWMLGARPARCTACSVIRAASR